MLQFHVNNRLAITITKTSKKDLKKLFNLMYDFCKRECTGADGKTKFDAFDHNFEYIAFGKNDGTFSDKLCGVFVDKMDRVDVTQLRLPFNKRYLSFPIYTGLKDDMYYVSTGFGITKDTWFLKDFYLFHDCDFIDIYLKHEYLVEQFHKKLFANGLIDYEPKSYFKW